MGMKKKKKEKKNEWNTKLSPNKFSRILDYYIMKHRVSTESYHFFFHEAITFFPLLTYIINEDDFIFKAYQLNKAKWRAQDKFCSLQ